MLEQQQDTVQTRLAEPWRGQLCMGEMPCREDAA